MNSPQEAGPALKWGLGNYFMADLVGLLSKENIPSAIGIQVDSLLVDAIFGQHAKKRLHRRHVVKSLTVEAPQTDGSIRKDVWGEFEDLKKRLTLDDYTPSNYVEEVKRSCPKFMQNFQTLGGRKEVERVLTWCVRLCQCDHST